MAITKFIKKQDSGFKLSAGNSGESSLNLSNEIVELLFPETINPGEEKEITFKIFKDDYIKAICFIISKLPLYRSSSNSSIKVNYDYAVFKELQDNVESIFGDNTQAIYKCTLLHREDGRYYLKGLKVKGFSIRNYLVENMSALVFDNANGEKTIRLLSNVTDDMEATTIKVENKLILSESTMTQFVYNCVSYFSEKKEIWKNIDKYVADANSIKEGDSIKIFKDGYFSLVGMFKCTTEDNIINYNTPRRRWFSEPFTIVGKTVFLSTEWYPGFRDNGTPYSLMLPDVAKFVPTCFGEEYQCVYNNGTWELWQIAFPKHQDDEDFLKTNPQAWIYAPGEQARLWADCQKQGLMRLGWDDLGDFSQFDSRQAVLSKMKEVYEADNKRNDATAVWQFYNEIQIGDIVYVKKGTNLIIGKGVVEGDYIYDESLDEYKNTRRIRWTAVGEWESPYRLPLKTLTRLYPNDPNIELLEQTISGTLKNEIPAEPFSIQKIIELIKETGLLYRDSLIKRFAFSLMAKRFLILSGLAGSGKTQLALAFASVLVRNKEEQMCVVSVGADWTNREPLLGFPNALRPNCYVKPESGVLDLLIEANRPENANKPFFLILDEMNMSYVERYFADFLSAMESKESISLWNSDDKSEGTSEETDEVPYKVALPNNLFIIGTINVDETTYMFSPKVLDRANVIEFKISREEMAGFLEDMKETNRESITSKAAGMGGDFVEKACKKELEKDDTAVKTLQDFFNELKNVNAEFGYRSATEIFRFICQAKTNDDATVKMTDNEILDAAIVQKLLPKLHGSRKKLDPVLQKLWKLCFARDIQDTTAIDATNVEKAIYKESADKICRMYKSAADNGFTSFAEA